MSTSTIQDPMRYAKLISGRIPEGAKVVGLYEDTRSGKWAMVQLKNGALVGYCGGVMRSINQRSLTSSGSRFYETKTTVERHTPKTIAHLDTDADPSLIR